MPPLDFDEYDRTEKVKVVSCMRPWFRAFHFAWLGFFTAFLGWFSFAPLMTYVKNDLGLTKSDVDSGNIASVSVTIFIRFALGPLCEIVGPRILMGVLLCVGSIPVFCSGLVTGAGSLIALRKSGPPCFAWHTSRAHTRQP